MEKQHHQLNQSIGPVSTFELAQLQDFFEENKISFEIEIDSDLKAAADFEMEIRGNGEFDPISRQTINRFDYTHAKFIFVQLSSEDALKSKSLFTNLSLSLHRPATEFSMQNADELLQAEDYMCVKCNHHSLVPGRCPVHQDELLPYFEYLVAKNKTEKNSVSYLLGEFFSYSVISLIIGGLAFFIYKLTVTQ